MKENILFNLIIKKFSNRSYLKKNLNDSYYHLGVCDNFKKILFALSYDFKIILLHIDIHYFE